MCKNLYNLCNDLGKTIHGFQTGLLTMWLGLLTLNFRSPKGSLKFFLGSSLAINSRRGIKNLFRSRQRENKNTAQKMASQSSTKQNGEATTEEVTGSIVTYTEEEINTFKDDMAPENTKKSTPLAIIVLNRDT